MTPDVAAKGAVASMMPYNRRFYLDEQKGSLESARQIIPYVLRYIEPGCVVDVGCGIGTWLSVFKSFGIREILGVDGDHVERDLLLIEEAEFVPHDLSRAFHSEKKFDLAVSLEVAEHLPATSAGTLVDTLTRLAPVVLFSAAIPAQGGLNHVNEQWPAYWTTLFAERGFIAIDCLRGEIWNLEGIKPHYAQNILFFVQESRVRDFPRLEAAREPGSSAVPMPLVHPGIFAYRVNQLMLARELKPGNVSLLEVVMAIPTLAAFQIRSRVSEALARFAPGVHDAIRKRKRRSMVGPST